MAKQTQEPSALDRRYPSLAINVLLFIVIFLLLYFIFVVTLPAVTGLWRLLPCWLLAYVMTWVLSSLSRGGTRLATTLLLMVVLFFVLTSRG